MSHVTRTLTRGGLLVLLASVLSCFIAVPLAEQASASTTAPSLSTFDSRLLYDINHARTIRGIRALRAVAGTTDVAHGWSCHMAGVHRLSHDLRLGTLLESHGSYYWTTYGENVGMTAAGADSLFRSYMNSPAHRANILDRTFRFVGLWTKRSGGMRWNTMDFVGSAASSYSYAYGGTRRTC
jgi:uncharacterized protein YkwD